MLAVHRNERNNRSKRTRPPIQGDVASGIGRERDDNLVQEHPPVVSARTHSMDFEDEDSINQGNLPGTQGKGLRSSHSNLVLTSNIDMGMRYIAHTDYPNQTYLLNHCKSDFIRLPFKFAVLCVKVFYHFMQETENKRLINSRDHCHGTPSTSS
jgi:hypothetical protein